jgi:hypothetical protein
VIESADDLLFDLPVVPFGSAPELEALISNGFWSEENTMPSNIGCPDYEEE